MFVQAELLLMVQDSLDSSVPNRALVRLPNGDVVTAKETLTNILADRRIRPGDFVTVAVDEPDPQLAYLFC